MCKSECDETQGALILLCFNKTPNLCVSRHKPLLNASCHMTKGIFHPGTSCTATEQRRLRPRLVTSHWQQARGTGRPHQGVPSMVSPERSSPSWKGTARPKSMALIRASSSLLTSMKFPGLMSRCRMLCTWHCANVLSTARMYDATYTPLAAVSVQAHTRTGTRGSRQSGQLHCRCRPSLSDQREIAGLCPVIERNGDAASACRKSDTGSCGGGDSGQWWQCCQVRAGGVPCALSSGCGRCCARVPPPGRAPARCGRASHPQTLPLALQRSGSC